MSESEKKVVVGEVVRQGSAIVVPPDMLMENAVRILQQKMEYEEQIVERAVVFEMHPYEVAHAFGQAITEICGYTLGKSTWSMWEGEQPPKEVSIEVEPGKFVNVPWGAIQFPFGGELRAHYQRQETGEVFGACLGTFRQKYSHIWEKIIAATRRILESESLFRGKTLRVQFSANGSRLNVPNVKAWDVSKVDTSHLVFSQELEASIEDHIRTPIRHRELCAAAGTPFKRGVLLIGPYGTGKTLLGASVAREAAAHGVTVIYIEDVSDLAEAIRMAARLAPAIVFGEDIDRVTDGVRDHAVDQLLNTLDGIDTKNFPVMTILTSNYPDKIYKGMIRPGRIDVALNILPPDSEAAQRLVKTYLGEMFDDKNGDLEEMGNALAGMIPAVIREICERSKLSAISRTAKLPGPKGINADDVLRSSRSMKNQIELLAAEPEQPSRVAEFVRLAETAVNGLEILQRPEIREFIEENV
jgi:transitional endoplasmic reticulum ATPase